MESRLIIHDTTPPNKIGAANGAPRLLFRAFGSFLHYVAGSAALTGAVADLARCRPRVMDTLHDKKMTKMLLELRADDGFTIRWLVREKGKRHGIYCLCLAAVLGVLAVYGWWLAFGVLISFVAGVGFCYLHWFRSRQRHWSLDKRIIDWEVVKKISEDEASA